MKTKTVFKAIIFGLIYFFISGLLPLISLAFTQLFGAALNFEPRTVNWIMIVGCFIGIFVVCEKFLEEYHPTGAGVFGISRYVLGLIDVTLYYNLLLHVGFIVPTIFPNIGFEYPYLVFTLNLVANNVFFALYLITLGLLIYGGYVINFFRYIYQMVAGFRLTKE
ncbi:MAG: hypothetical protein ACFFDN_05830 [Candidatus Hodarchaeota archaeon]